MFAYGQIGHCVVHDSSVPAVGSPRISGAFPLLHTAILARFGDTSDTDDSDLVVDIRDATHLSMATLYNFWDSDRIVLPWSQLTRLGLQIVFWFSIRGCFLSVFHLCPNLIQCTLQDTSGTSDLDLLSPGLYKHPKLKELFVSGCVHNVYGTLTFPSLRYMHIEDCQGVDPELLEFIARSGELKCLDLGSCGDTSLLVLTLLPALSHITDLMLDCSKSDANLFTVFFGLLGGVVPTCPKLETLEISDTVRMWR
ncbi:hypothetical protein B0H17DRAFT_377680 [Mycena rosella]|uniref:Uncharacterized protein n=1 Tax=Mycena rosella TaxID=1033263 RepID=A0AAD7CR69_MYCRO|nr:hypothetical protein B0H17DRAFT_377680 [Mycena rosella]